MGHSIIVFAAPDERLPEIKETFTRLVAEEDLYDCRPDWDYEIHQLEGRFEHENVFQPYIDKGARWCIEYQSDEYTDDGPCVELRRAITDIEFFHIDGSASY